MLVGVNMVRLQQAGHFEAILTNQAAKLKPKLRDLSCNSMLEKKR